MLGGLNRDFQLVDPSLGGADFEMYWDGDEAYVRKPGSSQLDVKSKTAPSIFTGCDRVQNFRKRLARKYWRKLEAPRKTHVSHASLAARS